MNTKLQDLLKTDIAGICQDIEMDFDEILDELDGWTTEQLKRHYIRRFGEQAYTDSCVYVG